MNNKPKKRSLREAKKKAIEALDASSTKKRSASTHEHFGRAKKARKMTSSAPSTPSAPSAPSASSASSERMDKDVEDVGTQFHKTPGTKRRASHANLIEHETISASDMQKQIAAEASGVSRKNIPWDKFRSIYLCDFSVQAQPKLAVKSVKKIGEENWEKQLLWDRLRQLLSDEVLCDLKLFYAGTETLPDANEGKEVSSKPDFVLHVGEESPMWADVELLFEHTQSRGQEAVTKKFSQWLRNAWSVFQHQHFRLHLYGIMFIQPCAYVCYADHGCAVYSEPLYFVKNIQHTQFLADFLTGFIANPKRRGRDPTVDPIVEEGDKIHIRHAETTWAELSKGQLCYRPCLAGRNIRVALVRELGAKFPKNKMIMKSTWEEKLPPASSPPSEVEVLKILEANVRGLPQPFALESAMARDDLNSVETRSFPENCEVALLAPTTNPMAKMQASFISNRVSESLTPGANVDYPLLPRVKIQRQQFNEPLEVRRQLTRILMSYCVPLKEAMRTRGPESLMRIIRDAMIVYYEAYKLPESGFIHGDISIGNILVPIEGCVLTGGLTYKDRSGTLIDWNLCFNASGESSNRAFESGTPAFMAPVLLEDKQIPRRTLGHDMESFFAVIIWIATFNYDDEDAFQAKPLAKVLLDHFKAPEDIVNAKENWFGSRKSFRGRITNPFEPVYRKDNGFLKCLAKLREILYPVEKFDWHGGLDENDNKVTDDADPMKQSLFRQCMKEIDDYLDETKGYDEMGWIDLNSLAQHTPEAR